MLEFLQPLQGNEKQGGCGEGQIKHVEDSKQRGRHKSGIKREE